MTDGRRMAAREALEIIHESTGFSYYADDSATHDGPEMLTWWEYHTGIIQRVIEQEALGLLNNIDHLRAELISAKKYLGEAMKDSDAAFPMATQRHWNCKSCRVEGVLADSTTGITRCTNRACWRYKARKLLESSNDTAG